MIVSIRIIPVRTIPVGPRVIVVRRIVIVSVRPRAVVPIRVRITPTEAQGPSGAIVIGIPIRGSVVRTPAPVRVVVVRVEAVIRREVTAVPRRRIIVIPIVVRVVRVIVILAVVVSLIVVSLIVVVLAVIVVLAIDVVAVVGLDNGNARIRPIVHGGQLGIATSQGEYHEAADCCCDLVADEVHDASSPLKSLWPT